MDPTHRRACSDFEADQTGANDKKLAAFNEPVAKRQGIIEVSEITHTRRHGLQEIEPTWTQSSRQNKMSIGQEPAILHAHALRLAIDFDYLLPKVEDDIHLPPA